MSKIKKSEIFWNIIAILLIFGTVLITPKAFIILQCVMMFLFVIIAFTNIGERDKDRLPYPLFLWINPIGFTLLLALGFIEALVWLYTKPVKWVLDNPIQKFNSWLDAERVKKMKFKEFAKEETKK